MGMARDWKRSDNTWDNFKILVASPSRFFWTQQWFMGYMAWAFFVGNECKSFTCDGSRAELLTILRPASSHGFNDRVVLHRAWLCHRIGQYAVPVLCTASLKAKGSSARGMDTSAAFHHYSLCRGGNCCSLSSISSTTCGSQGTDFQRAASMRCSSAYGIAKRPGKRPNDQLLSINLTNGERSYGLML